MRKNAYRLGREMIWTNVAQLYMHIFRTGSRWKARRCRENLWPSRRSTRNRGNCRS